ncbi:hypothetical protein G5B30_02780 [Sphingobacterium sp. SGG-5]|uniref:hypothetical protein n=1 Tax=Sphingobacterium sp. SGG-5 TaxID=2710881 RepID=UPI0013ED87B6|nr:hypothetical protein [Sphingobacterium sp. SGG-5]NGM60836.1 hypothetical protein [Sphingobacterium sp. SGG-5]
MKTIKKINSYILLGFVLFTGCSAKDNPDIETGGDNPGTENSAHYYVAPSPRGIGDGSSEENAADFLSAVFWDGIRKQLLSKPVEVQFVKGYYERAYVEKGLAFERIGHPEHRLILRGGKSVNFPVLPGYEKRNTLVSFHGAQNITFSDFHFMGDGAINYVVAVRTPSGFPPSKNILIENCTWTDMRGTEYGATGCHYEGTTDVTYKNCTFRRIGNGTGAHMMYHAYGPNRINVIDCHFENCTGEYVRFRDRSDFAMVKNCTFKRDEGWIGAAFISIPNYNDVDPGDEYFGVNYSFTGNVFQNTRYAIQFRHTGFSPTEYNYLLTAEEGAILENGTKPEKVKLLKDNFGLDVSKIRIADNSYDGIYDKHVSINSGVLYGAESLGWTGTVDITNIFDSTIPPFDWEP